MAEYIYKAFNPAEDIIGGKTKLKTFPIWTDSVSDVDVNPESIIGDTDNPIYTSSAEVTGSWEGNYYYNIYSDNVDERPNAEVQFSIAFATTRSVQLETNLQEEYQYTYPSRAVYSQFLSTLEQTTIANTGGFFKIQPSPGVTALSDIPVAYVISIARSRIKDKIELDTWQLNLSGSAGGLTLINQTGSATGVTSVPIIIGDLGATLGADQIDSKYRMPANIISSFGTQMGLFYPQYGVFILDAAKIHTYIGSSSAGYNPTAVAASSSYAPSASLGNFWELIKRGGYFRARTTENVQSTHYFCRVKNYEFNYSTNPTWVSGSNNEILDAFYTEPRTFITTVGLYDGDSDSGQLVAVAKLSRPIPKDGESEALIKVKLDF